MKRSYVFLTTEKRDLFFETMKELGYDYRTVSRPTEIQVELVIENIAGADLGEIKSRMIRLGGRAVSDGESCSSARFHPGDKVFWRDPDQGLASRIYTILSIEYLESDVVRITEEDGSVLECHVSELE